MSALTYPTVSGQTNPLKVSYNYDPTYGQLQTITDTTVGVSATKAPFWTLQSIDYTGQFTNELFGNGVVQERLPNSTNPMKLGEIRVTQNGTTSHPTTLRDVNYTLDGKLNLTSRVDNVSGRSETFAYDPLARLSLWTWQQSGTTQQQVQYNYDDIGNMTSRLVKVGSGSNIDFTFDATKAGPHQPLSSEAGSYAYDGNGRQKAAPGRTVAFNELDLPTSITNTVTSDVFSFQYDGENQRLVKSRSNGDVTVTAGDYFERRTVGGVTTVQETVLGPFGPVAQMSTSGGATSTVYLHAGHQGSIELITGDNGVVVDQPAFDPFGARIQSAPPETPGSPPASGVDWGFTGMRHDDEAALSGLIDMHGRVYDPTQARFLSLDPMPIHLGSQGHNRYAFVSYSPLSHLDPTGFDEMDFIDRNMLGGGQANEPLRQPFGGSNPAGTQSSGGGSQSGNNQPGGGGTSAASDSGGGGAQSQLPAPPNPQDSGPKWDGNWDGRSDPAGRSTTGNVQAPPLGKQGSSNDGLDHRPVFCGSSSGITCGDRKTDRDRLKELREFDRAAIEQALHHPFTAKNGKVYKNMLVAARALRVETSLTHVFNIDGWGNPGFYPLTGTPSSVQTGLSPISSGLPTGDFSIHVHPAGETIFSRADIKHGKQTGGTLYLLTLDKDGAVFMSRYDFLSNSITQILP